MRTIFFGLVHRAGPSRTCFQPKTGGLASPCRTSKGSWQTHDASVVKQPRVKALVEQLGKAAQFPIPLAHPVQTKQ